MSTLTRAVKKIATIVVQEQTAHWTFFIMHQIMKTSNTNDLSTMRHLIHSRLQFHRQKRHGIRVSQEIFRLVHHGPRGPGDKSTPWERKAYDVKDTDQSNPYLDLIRDTHDPSMQLKTLEDELKGTIGRALGKQGEKILDALRQMKQHYDDYEEALRECDYCQHDKRVIQHAQQFNAVRERAVHARWELIVHRQAVGMIVNNHRYVLEQYPIADAIPVPKATDSDENDSNSLDESQTQQDASSSKQKPCKKEWGDQLDWWQKVGRWR